MVKYEENNKWDYCYFCGFDKILHKHHIVFKVNGGKDNEENLIILCPNCHALIHSNEYSLEIREDDMNRFYILFNIETKEVKYPFAVPTNSKVILPKGFN